MAKMNYIPEFTIDNDILALVSDISILVGLVSQEDMPSRNLKLKRTNKIRSIQSSLAIEGNTLSIDEVTDIIEGKRVAGSPREVQEVISAIEAYDMMPNLNPHSLDDLLNAHHTMMQSLIESPGRLRDCNVGVFDGATPVHIAPDHQKVPQLMQELIDWAKDDECHPLIKGCMFHCRFEYIHPFTDGNGRMGRLWHSLILSKWNELFLHLPVESWVKLHQGEYYRVLRMADWGNATEFIRFMSNMMDKALNEFIDDIQSHKESLLTERERTVLEMVMKNPHITAMKIAEGIGTSERTVKRYISELVKKKVIERVGSDKTGYWKLN